MNPLLATLRSASASNPLRRGLAIEAKVLDQARGLVRFTASDETLDCHNEIVRASGWRFTHFSKNAPFVDSHDYSSITKLLGQVVAYGVEGKALVEDVQYALTPAGDTLADWAFKMVDGGFLRAVSVGFCPRRYATKWDSDKSAFLGQISELGLDAATAATLNVVYIEHEQLELSQCVLGANPNALAKAYKAGALSERDLDKLCALRASLETASPAPVRAAAGAAHVQRAKLALLAAIQTHL